MTKKQTTVLTALSIAALILALLVSRRIWFRLDLTRNRAYTISKISRNIGAELPDQARITYYLSDKLRSVDPMPGEIEDLLREYAAYSRGKIRVAVRDPVKANLADRLEQIGVMPRQIQSLERDQASFVTVYSGIVIEYLDKAEVLPWVFSLDTLEYDLTSRIRSLARDSERQIGIIIGDASRQWGQDYGYLGQALAGAGYRARLIPPGDEIPDTLPVLFVLGGAEELDDWALYRIDRYIQLGGKVLFAAEGISVDTASGALEAKKLNDQGLLEMIASYGASIRPELALDRSALALQYQTRAPSGAVQMRIIRYPHWIGVLAENGNPAHPVSAQFGGIDLFWPSPLEFHPPEGVEALPLFTSTAEAWAMRDPFNTSPDIAYLFERDASETRGVKILGASLAGTFPGWFKGAPPPEREGSGETLPAMPAEAKTSRIIVVGDIDFATNLISVSGARQNLDFLLKAADWLGNDDDIIGIRNRESLAGRLDRITDPETKAAAAGMVQIINVIIMPLLVIAAGFFLAWRRRARTQARSAVRPADDSSKERNDDV